MNLVCHGKQFLVATTDIHVFYYELQIKCMRCDIHNLVLFVVFYILQYIKVLGIILYVYLPSDISYDVHIILEKKRFVRNQLSPQSK